MPREHQFSSTDDDEPDISPRSCGIGKCTPAWLQRFADPRAYLFFFCLIGILQGAYFTYFVGILSTLEKRYAFDSGITGIILIADNLSPAIFVIFVGYYGKYAHRPRLVTFGMMITVFSCFISCVPYMIYGARNSDVSDSYLSSKNKEPMLCSNTRNTSNKCNFHEQSQSYTAISILFIANFLNGFGSMAYYTVGTPYMDDNVKKKKSPLYLGATFALRIIGPVLGFMLSSFSLKYYENPFDDPGFSNDDPRWIGAWWIGFLILGGALFLVSFPIAFFPRELEQHSALAEQTLRFRSTRSKLSDLLLSLRKLVQNPILVFHTLSITFQINGIFGYYVFMPKYMESQYQKTASSASFFSGTTSLITTIAGVFLGGILIQKVKPRPRYLTGYMVFVELFAGIGLISSLFFGCPSLNISGLNKETRLFDLYDNCNKNCGCSEIAFDPICGADATYFSPCFAGCYNYTTRASTMVFQNCSCVDTDYFVSNITDVKQGYCSDDCNMFLPYFIILSLSKVFASTAKVGNVLVTLRCVNDEDKTLALGAVEFVVSLFATIPYPLIYGHVIDNCCLVWEENCGRRGNCRLYDRDRFRLYLHGLSIIFMFLGTCCDAVVFFLSKRMKHFYGNVPGAETGGVELEERQHAIQS